MSYISRPTVTRAANTTAYTAGDVVGGVINFKGFPAQADVMITSADLRIDIASIPSGMTSFRMHLYKERPASAYVDNDAWDLPSGDRDDYIGFVDIGVIVDQGSTLYVQNHRVLLLRCFDRQRRGWNFSHHLERHRDKHRLPSPHQQQQQARTRRRKRNGVYDGAEP